MQGTNCRRCPVLHIAHSPTDRKASKTALQSLRSFSDRFSLLCSCVFFNMPFFVDTSPAETLYTQAALISALSRSSCVCVWVCVCVCGSGSALEGHTQGER